ncbi:hypothetical protein K503DRAFT_231377 [Rhizopogon vinicolor AM-OR11-026]|uniref:Uncharacterized protein n=1 Tax=Rhizopogon vinicolor AM-OR11-026 TaxID=1314800 RepID=A0A1B7MXZ0_9AGAM|nr:hypothetical protein K503DRAFT_231377 [Rhizopogon vinicolor AM-OR11-026]
MRTPANFTFLASILILPPHHPLSKISYLDTTLKSLQSVSLALPHMTLSPSVSYDSSEAYLELASDRRDVHVELRVFLVPAWTHKMVDVYTWREGPVMLMLHIGFRCIIATAGLSGQYKLST